MPAEGASASMICPHASTTAAPLPPEDRPTTADCYIAIGGVRVPLNTPDVRIDVPAGSSIFAVSTVGI
jgi:hypothetical protein